MKLAKMYMKRVAMELQYMGPLNKDPALEYMLLQAVRFAFRMHQVTHCSSNFTKGKLPIVQISNHSLLTSLPHTDAFLAYHLPARSCCAVVLSKLQALCHLCLNYRLFFFFFCSLLVVSTQRPWMHLKS